MENRGKPVECRVGILMAAVAIALPPTLFARSPAGSAACGSVLMANVTLEEDLVCSGDALTVGANGVRVDLNGHTITGSGIGVGITIRGRSLVVVKGGTVRGFVTGVLIAASTGVVIKESRFTENREGVFGIN